MYEPGERKGGRECEMYGLHAELWRTSFSMLFEVIVLFSKMLDIGI